MTKQQEERDADKAEADAEQKGLQGPVRPSHSF